MNVNQKIDKLLEERSLVDTISKKAKGMYYNIKGEPGINDFQGKNRDFIDKGDEVILSPSTYGKNVAMLEPKEMMDAMGGNDRTQYNMVDALSKVRSGLWDKAHDPSIAKENEDILSAMMGQPVRYSDRFHDKDFNEPYKGIAAGENENLNIGTAINEKIQNNSNMHHLTNKLQAATMNSDKLDSLGKINMHDGSSSAIEIADKLDNFDFI